MCTQYSAFGITLSDLETESQEDIHDHLDNNTGIHFYSKHKYTDTFGDAHIQYHDFDNGDAFVYKDKYTALLQQELQNPYWCLHNPITTKAIRYLLTWTLKLSLTPCIFLAIHIQLLKLIMSHTKPYRMMIKVCSMLNQWTILLYKFY